MPTAPILSLRDLDLEIADTRILRKINWTIQAGEHWAILGANGCGKTSLLSALTAYQSPSSGTIECLGETFGQADWIELRRKIGMVSSHLTRRVPADEPAIETVLSGESAQLGYWTRDKVQNTAKALRCLSKMQVRKLAHRDWGVLSQGERQKVFCARALMADPKLLILDEPCAGLDPVARERFLDSLQALCQSKKAPSCLLVTHHIEEIIPEITHVLLMKNGAVSAAGPKADILNSKQLSHAFGAELRVRKLPHVERWSMCVV